MQKYIYEGPVTGISGICIMNHWVGETTAVSPSKAKSNLMYRFKTENNLLAGSKIDFPGKIREV